MWIKRRAPEQRLDLGHDTAPSIVELSYWMATERVDPRDDPRRHVEPVPINP